MFYYEKPENFQSDIEVVGCYPEYDGKLLFLLRHESKVEGNTWCVPGGKIDAGETLHQAIIRELQEETGIVANENQVKYFSTIYKSEPNFSITFHIFSLKLLEMPEVQLSPGEHTEFVWVTPEECLKMNLISDEDKCIKMLYNI